MPTRCQRPAVAVLLVLAAAAAHADPDCVPPDAARTALMQASIDSLQASYLACDEQSRTRGIDAAAMRHCGLVGEVLRDRAFGGDFERLIAWWRSQRTLARAAVPGL